jgi:hypothetical protein
MIWGCILRKSVTTKFALFPAYFLLIIFLISGVAINHAWSQPQTDENVCDGLTGAAYGLCNAYCNAMDCANPNHHASQTACDRVEANFYKISDASTLPDCDPCGYLVPRDDPEPYECPCDFSASYPSRDCWSNELDFSTCPMAPLGTKNDCSPGPSVINYWCSFSFDIFGGDPGILVAGFEDNNNQAWACLNYASSDSCGGIVPQELTGLTYAQANTCICRLEQEVKTLAQVTDIANAIVYPFLTIPYTCAPPMINP